MWWCRWCFTQWRGISNRKVWHRSPFCIRWLRCWPICFWRAIFQYKLRWIEVALGVGGVWGISGKDTDVGKTGGEREASAHPPPRPPAPPRHTGRPTQTSQQGCRP